MSEFVSNICLQPYEHILRRFANFTEVDPVVVPVSA